MCSATPALSLNLLFRHPSPRFRLDKIYIYLYTSRQFTAIVAHVSDETEKAKLAIVVWEGDSREVLKAFSERSRKIWDLSYGSSSKARDPDVVLPAKTGHLN